jgi:O-antigen/teichoic acid export membrane protein
MSAGIATGRQIAKGASWMMGFKLFDRVVGLGSIVILARLLAPADFGLVAMAMSVVALLELMGAFGFDTALIQRQDTERRHFDTAWTFNVLFGIGIAAMLLVLALPAAEYYQEPRLQYMLPVLAVGALIAGLENIGTVAFRKELDFRKEFLFLAAKRIAGVAVTIPLAFAFRSFWALVAGIVTGKVLGVLISYRIHPYRPRLSLAAREELMSFSKWLFVSNLIQFLHTRAPDFILGRVVGSHGLGLFRMATEIGMMPSTEMIAPLNRAVYPAYAQLATDRERLRERIHEVIGVINLIAVPVSVGLYCVSDLVVTVMLGPKWQEAIGIMQIAALTGMLSALQTNTVHVMMAIGRPKVPALVQGAMLCVFLPVLMLASLHYGALGAAAAQMFAAALGLLGMMAVFSREARFPLVRWFSLAWRPLVASVAMAFVLGATEQQIGVSWPTLPNVVRLAIQICLGALVYVGTVAMLWSILGKPAGPEKTLLSVAVERLGSFRRPHAKPS